MAGDVVFSHARDETPGSLGWHGHTGGTIASGELHAHELVANPDGEPAGVIAHGCVGRWEIGNAG